MIDKARNKPSAVRSRDVALSAVIIGGPVDFRLAGGPWWAELSLAALGLVTVAIRIVFPQDSPDKLAWWRERRTRRGRTGGRHRSRQ